MSYARAGFSSQITPAAAHSPGKLAQPFGKVFGFKSAGARFTKVSKSLLLDSTMRGARRPRCLVSTHGNTWNRLRKDARG